MFGGYQPAAFNPYQPSPFGGGSLGNLPPQLLQLLGMSGGGSLTPGTIDRINPGGGGGMAGMRPGMGSGPGMGGVGSEGIGGAQPGAPIFGWDWKDNLKLAGQTLGMPALMALTGGAGAGAIPQIAGRAALGSAMNVPMQGLDALTQWGADKMGVDPNKAGAGLNIAKTLWGLFTGGGDGAQKAIGAAGSLPGLYQAGKTIFSPSKKNGGYQPSIFNSPYNDSAIDKISGRSLTSPMEMTKDQERYIRDQQTFENWQKLQAQSSMFGDIRNSIYGYGDDQWGPRDRSSMGGGGGMGIRGSISGDIGDVIARMGMLF